MATHAEIGMNRTGIGTSPELSDEMVKGMDEFGPSTASAGDGMEMAQVRADYARSAEPIGHITPPSNVKGMAKAAVKALKGQQPALFIDKIGERLAFERTGTRLYAALLTKFDALGGFEGGPARAEIVEILEEEYAHVQLLRDAAVKLGADPTLLTPSADLQATISRGVLEAVVDARTDVPQCLEAALVAELSDNECWSALVELAERAGEDEIARSFAEALDDEEEHLWRVRRWVAAAQGREAPEASAPPPA
jgi:bacterioferritin (cytochrome b1)